MSQYPLPTEPFGAQPFLLTIGDIGITQDSIVTPNGTAPLIGSQWMVADMTTTRQTIPTVGIVLAVVFALFCLLGLLFLLMKETVTSGYVQVAVNSGSLRHITQIPVNDATQVAMIRAQVAQAQSMA